MTHLSDTTLLALLQQSEYDMPSFERWVKDHQDDTTLGEIQPEKWTLKLKLIRIVTRVFFFLPSRMKFKLAVLVVTPIELAIRKSVYLQAQLKLRMLRKKGLLVVAIAGSYAKTSTKTQLAHLLGDQLNVLITPKSINTPLGIAQIIRKSLKSEHQLFVVEMGEYNPEDIGQLTSFIKPDYAILTPIGRQHLEKFGSIEKIANSFKPLLERFKAFDKTSSESKKVIVAAQNETLFPELATPTYSDLPQADWHTTSITVSRRGTEFTVCPPSDLHPEIGDVFMPLYGSHQAINSLPSFWLAAQLKLDLNKVAARAASLPFIDRRHQPHFAENNVLILDNSYNTNPDSVRASLQLLDELDATRKLILTAGFAELGADADQIHHVFGKQLAAHVDFAGLIETPWSQHIINGFVEAGGKREHIVTGKDFDQVLATLSGMIIPNSVVLFEGGYREIYV